MVGWFLDCRPRLLRLHGLRPERRWKTHWLKIDRRMWGGVNDGGVMSARRRWRWRRWVGGGGRDVTWSCRRSRRGRTPRCATPRWSSSVRGVRGDRTGRHGTVSVSVCATRAGPSQGPRKGPENKGDRMKENGCQPGWCMWTRR